MSAALEGGEPTEPTTSSAREDSQGEGATELAAASEAATDEVEIEVLPDGRVRLHARCRVGQDPADCQARIDALVEALGVPAEGVEQVISQE